MKKNQRNLVMGASPSNPLETMHERLLEIYWDKKNIEEFLPRIATYSTQKELLSIVLAQLSVIEKQLIWLMREITEAENSGKLRLH